MRSLFFVALLLGLVSTTSAQKKTISEASLKGQWKSEADDRMFFADIQADGLGKYTLIQPGNITLTNGQKAGKAVFKHQYKIVRVIPEKRTIIVLLKFARGGEREETLVFSEDGKTIAETTKVANLETTVKLTYVDGKTEP